MSLPIYTFSTNVPQANQKISATQQSILNNFQAINELVDVNHASFSDPVYFGTHRVTNFVLQDSDPSTAADQMTLYAKTVTGSVNPCEIFYRYPSDGTIVQLTGLGSTGSAVTNGYSYLGTNIMQWGLATGITASGDNTISFNTPYTSVVYFAQFTPAGSYTISVPGAYVSATSLTDFTLTTTGTMSTSVYWFALGI